jgi:hypothetical protein
MEFVSDGWYLPTKGPAGHLSRTGRCRWLPRHLPPGAVGEAPTRTGSGWSSPIGVRGRASQPSDLGPRVTRGSSAHAPTGRQRMGTRDRRPISLAWGMPIPISEESEHEETGLCDSRSFASCTRVQRSPPSSWRRVRSGRCTDVDRS